MSALDSGRSALAHVVRISHEALWAPKGLRKELETVKSFC